MHGYSLAAGSAVGRDHRHSFRNNQDAYTVLDDGGVMVAVVADGCGSGRFSEVGALIGARLVARSIREAYDDATRSVRWNEANSLILTELDRLVAALGGDSVRTVLDYLLFTVIGVVADSTTTTFFSVGDGTLVINGTVTRYEYPNNEPPYLAYALLPPGKVVIDRDLLRLRPVQTAPNETVQSFLIGTDGVDDLIRHEETPLPGIERSVGPLAQFWTADRYFRGNPELLSRQLRLIGRDWPMSNPQPGLLHDDTTVIVGRRDVQPESE